MVSWARDVYKRQGEVDAQVQGAGRAGIDEYLLWCPAVESAYDGSS